MQLPTSSRINDGLSQNDIQEDQPREYLSHSFAEWFMNPDGIETGWTPVRITGYTLRTTKSRH